MIRLLEILRARMRGRYTEIDSPAHFVPVIDHWLQSTNLESVRMMPTLLTDTSDRPDIGEYVKIHNKEKSAGDVVSQWGLTMENPSRTVLMLKITKPVIIEFALVFNFLRDYWIIDAIQQNYSVLIIAGKKEESKFDAIGRPSVFLEITATIDGWDERLHNQLINMYLAKGLSIEVSRSRAEEDISNRRLAADFRADNAFDG